VKVHAAKNAAQAAGASTPTRSYADAYAIAAAEMAPLIALGATLVLTPCAVGWIATCWTVRERSISQCGWSLGVFNAGEQTTMHFPAIELCCLRFMIEQAGARLAAAGAAPSDLDTALPLGRAATTTGDSLSSPRTLVA